MPSTMATTTEAKPTTSDRRVPYMIEDSTSRPWSSVPSGKAQEPSFAQARLALGKLYLRTDRLPEAVGELERVIKLDPNLAEAYYHLGRAYVKLKRTAEAIQTWPPCRAGWWSYTLVLAQSWGGLASVA